MKNMTAAIAARSFQYTAAAALLDGCVGIDTFADRRRFAPDMVALLQHLERLSSDEVAELAGLLT